MRVSIASTDSFPSSASTCNAPIWYCGKRKMSLRVRSAGGRIRVASRPSASSTAVMFYNRLTRFHAHEYFVTNRNSTQTFWFEEEPLPPYAWENTQSS